jgi:hypothetical protein
VVKRKAIIETTPLYAPLCPLRPVRPYNRYPLYHCTPCPLYYIRRHIIAQLKSCACCVVSLAINVGVASHSLFTQSFVAALEARKNLRKRNLREGSGVYVYKYARLWEWPSCSLPRSLLSL